MKHHCFAAGGRQAPIESLADNTGVGWMNEQASWYGS